MKKAAFFYFKTLLQSEPEEFFLHKCIWGNPLNLLLVTLSFPAHLLADDRGDNETVAVHRSGEIPCRVHQSVWKQLID
jgi:hypothetical protein